MVLVRRYETRKTSRAQEPGHKSRVDWRRTKRGGASQLLDSDEDCGSSDSVASADSVSSGEGVSSAEGLASTEGLARREGEAPPEALGRDPGPDGGRAAERALGLTAAEAEAGPAPGGDADEDEEPVRRGGRRRVSPVRSDSGDSEGSDVLARRAGAKRPRRVLEEEGPAERSPPDPSTPGRAAAARRLEQRRRLEALARRRARGEGPGEESCPSSGADDSVAGDGDGEGGEEPEEGEEPEGEEQEPDASEGSGEPDGYVFDDFVVQDPEGDGQGEGPRGEALSTSPLQLVKRNPLYSFSDHYTHFERVVKALLINALDQSFLASLYDGRRRKSYAQEMLTSLDYLDNRFVRPRLESLVSRSRWKEQYKERVESYSAVSVRPRGSEQRSCQACGLHRCCRYSVRLSGRLYNARTLEADDFMARDTQVFAVGNVCAKRTQVYHKLRHFKFELYRECCSIARTEGGEDEEVKETVERLFGRSRDGGWIRQKYAELEGYLNSADYFQDEKFD